MFFGPVFSPSPLQKQIQKYFGANKCCLSDWHTKAHGPNMYVFVTSDQKWFFVQLFQKLSTTKRVLMAGLASWTQRHVCFLALLTKSHFSTNSFKNVFNGKSYFLKKWFLSNSRNRYKFEFFHCRGVNFEFNFLQAISMFLLLAPCPCPCSTKKMKVVT